MSYIGDQSQWEAVTQSHAYQAADRLIDSNGNLYALGRKSHHAVVPELLGTISLNEAIKLLQAHAAQGGHCCVAKISASSIQQAIQLVGSLDDESS